MSDAALSTTPIATTPLAPEDCARIVLEVAKIDSNIRKALLYALAHNAFARRGCVWLSKHEAEQLDVQRRIHQTAAFTEFERSIAELALLTWAELIRRVDTAVDEVLTSAAGGDLVEFFLRQYDSFQGGRMLSGWCIGLLYVRREATETVDSLVV